MEKPAIQSEKIYITKSIEFSAAHYYYLEDLSKDENFKIFGKCSNKNSHGHNYILHVTLKGEASIKTGMIINLIDLKEILKDKIIKVFDHKNLNLDTPYFSEILPTTEYLTHVIWGILNPELSNKLAKVTIFEEEDFYCYYKGEVNMYYLTRVYKFSASHRLHNVCMKEDENILIFGKCNNATFHGHNFKLEVTLKGNIDNKTGMLINIINMDRIINEQIINLLDHKNLNTDVDDLKNTITTGENLVRFIWDKLYGLFYPAELHRLKLFETDRNYFEYYGG
ncbi:MAG: 6-carboxytetrahydropterin synthase [Cyanobacteriota bacterium]